MDYEDIIEALKNGEELFFVDAKGKDERGFTCWFRNPMLSRENASYMVEEMLSDKSYSNINLRSETSLNEYHKIYDEKSNEWVDDMMTEREVLFGGMYQGLYEDRCKRAEVNLDLVSEWESKRQAYKKEKKTPKRK